MIFVPWEEYGDRRQKLTIAAGGSGRIYYYEIPKGYVAFLTHLYCCYFANCYIEMKMDQWLVDTFRVQVGNIEEPFEFNPPYVFTRDIEFWGYNNDKSSHVFEIKCDGQVYDKMRSRRAVLAEKHS